jgi:predicted nucleotidyltransferase component of viral defense system
MKSAALKMLEEYSCLSQNDYENAVKQIIQQISLLGLWRTKFFEHAAFYGGTALRMLYHLNRFSEDMDFTLLSKNKNFSIQSYHKGIEAELASFGFETEFHVKEKSKQTAIQSAFLKTNTLMSLININAPKEIQEITHGRAQIKVKLEIDTNPPLGFDTDVIPLLDPIPCWIKTVSKPDLFAGKVSAVLCRQWGTRIKGRDWYDFLWFIQQNIPLHIKHLEARLRQFGFYQREGDLDATITHKMILDKIQSIDVVLAKQDIIKFISNPDDLAAWNRSLFEAALNKIKYC